MEVHHHSHTPRNKWSHYFWEFFMLFLAVSLGFFVENQREHIVEHHREKQYIRSMIVDLAADTTKLMQMYPINQRIIDQLDSILINYSKFATGKPQKVFFDNSRALRGFPDFIYTDRTINQLKSSGGMRLIRKQAASDSIISYDDLARDYLIEQESTSGILKNMTAEYNSVFNFQLFREVSADSTRWASFKNMNVLLTNDPQQLGKFYNAIYLFQGAIRTRNFEIIILRNAATRLIHFLREQYHIK